ncbi:hypothetical protein ACJX0J_023662 [Zea mays]
MSHKFIAFPIKIKNPINISFLPEHDLEQPFDFLLPLAFLHMHPKQAHHESFHFFQRAKAVFSVTNKLSCHNKMMSNHHIGYLLDLDFDVLLYETIYKEAIN